MKNLIKILVFTVMIGIMPAASNAQVVMKEFLSQDHPGKVDKSMNNNGKPLYYKFQYKSTEGARINYVLYIYKDAGMGTPWLTLPVLMRNLMWTYYVDITFSKDGMDKVAAMIYKKDLRWSRVKYSPHEGCSKVTPVVWERENMVDNFDGLLNDFIMQLDKNVDLNCYTGGKPK